MIETSDEIQFKSGSKKLKMKKKTIQSLYFGNKTERNNFILRPSQINHSKIK